MQLRPYQTDAINATFDEWAGGAQSVLGVAATGLGKTVMFANIIARHPGRTMVIAHREELIFQAVEKIEKVSGIRAEIEMAEYSANEGGLLDKSRVVVSTIQTQCAGSKGGRMQRFNPHNFDLFVIDEAHHAVAGSYKRAIEHYRQNQNLRIFGVTATPDRADEAALGQVFERVAFDYDLRFGVDQSWLVPVMQRIVDADAIDLSSVRSAKHDMRETDVARVLEGEAALHQIATPTIELTSDGRRTLIFCASLAHAESLTEILNRHKPNSAYWVSGDTPKDERRRLFKAYAEGCFQYLCNVGVATEGFDDPGIATVVMARPTKSRSLYAQMVGRGTRALPGLIDGLGLWDSPDTRRDAIANSDKPSVEVIDFVGNCGRHRLVTTADLLGGNYDDRILEKAKRKIAESKDARDMRKAISDVEEEERIEREKAKSAEAARRASLVAKVKYTTRTVDPFDVFGIEPWREKGWDKGKKPTERMVALLEKQGVKTNGLNYTQASQLISAIKDRWDKRQCSYKQAKILASRGKPTNVTFEEAQRMITEISTREGWGSSGSREDSTSSYVSTPSCATVDAMALPRF